MPTILIAEDQPITRELLRRLLTSEGYTVHAAATGSAALALLIDGVQPDLLILDLLLPKMSGSELFETLHEHPTWRSIPVIVLTGSMAESQLNRVRELKASAILQKAKFDIDHLFEEIREALKPRREPVTT
jgi:CheY-like chemotaxis protein